MDSAKVEVRETKLGKGVFAIAIINAGETIASFDGKFLDPYDEWTDDLSTHVIQFARYRWRESEGIARLINHSCEANAGIRNLFDIVAMRRIEPGEEVCWDYEMSEDSDWWRMRCRCGSPRCRKVIGAYRKMPREARRRYKGYISEWLVKEGWRIQRRAILRRVWRMLRRAG